ncbi:MAG: hypothetical protein ACKOFP_12765, partial [Actinomycetota bacterium]
MLRREHDPARSHIRVLVAAATAVLTAASVMVGAPAAWATNAVTVTSSASTVAPGSTLDLTAAMPVSNAGTVSQEIVQTIDPTKVKLTSASDITYPVGWTLSYCSGSNTNCDDSANFSATTPANAAAWANVKAVKASGSIVSEGASGTGKQVASRTTAGILASVGGSLFGAGTYDGWDVFFDPGYTRVFNRPHHMPQGSDPVIDCHWLRTENGHTSGGSCWGSPYSLPRATWTSSNRSSGYIDGSNRLWLEMTKRGSGHGFMCLDVSGATPVGCSVGIWHQLEAAPVFESYDEVMDIASVGGKVFTQSVTGSVLCLDTLATSGPAPCPGQPYNFGGPSGSFGMADTVSELGDIKEISGKIYYLRSTSNTSGAVTCIDPALITTSASVTSIRCSGWPAGLQSIGSRPLFAVPNSQGVLVAVCGYVNSTCVNLNDGSSAIAGLPAGFTTYVQSKRYGALGAGGFYSGPTTVGKRIYWPNRPLGQSDPNTKLECFDASTNAACSGWPKTVPEMYAVRVDPMNPQCIWTNANDGRIRVFDAVTGSVGCTAVAPVVSFPAGVSVPRMACSAATGIQEWVDFRIAGAGDPAKQWSSATLTVRDPAGSVITGWDSVLIPANGVLPLTGLPVSGGSGASAWVADDLDFRVTFADPTYTSSPSATIKAIGDAPQLCVKVTALVTCPAASAGPLPTPASATLNVLGDGSSTDGSNVTTPMTRGTATVTISAPASVQCG